MDKAAVLLPKVERKANQPWISCDTLQLLELRRQARAQHDCENERKFHKEARNHAKLDRTRWMDSLLEEGNWQQIRALRKPRKLKCGRLKNSSGQLVESDQWADTMADHLEHVQWYVRPVAWLMDPPWDQIYQ